MVSFMHTMGWTRIGVIFLDDAWGRTLLSSRASTG